MGETFSREEITCSLNSSEQLFFICKLICNAKSGCRKMHKPEFQFDHTKAKNKGSLFTGERTDTYVDD